MSDAQHSLEPSWRTGWSVPSRQGFRRPGREVRAQPRARGRRAVLDPCLTPLPTPPPADSLLGGAAPERERAGQDPFPARDRGEAEEPDGLHLVLGQRGRLQRRGGRAPQRPGEGTDTAGRWGPWHGSLSALLPLGSVGMGPAPGIPAHPAIPSRTSLGSPQRVCGVGAHGDERSG